MHLFTVHVVDADLDGSAVSLQSLRLGELHDGLADVAQALGR